MSDAPTAWMMEGVVGGFKSGIGGGMATGLAENGALAQANSMANNAATLFGGADALHQVVEHGMFNMFDEAAAGARWYAPAGDAAADAATGLPGSNLIGHAGGALAGLGLVNDFTDMYKHGRDTDNTMSAVGNGLGLGSWAAGLGLGFMGGAGGAAATVAAPLMAAGSGGMAIGGLINSMADSSYGTDENGRGRDDHWQQSIVDDAVANGEDPLSAWNIAKGTAAGSWGQMVDAGSAVGNWAGSWF